MTVLPSSRRSVTPEELAFATMFGIPAHIATILASLYAGETVQAARWTISNLRTALEAESVDTVPGGYRLTEIGRHECLRAIGEFRNWINGRYAA